MSKAHAFLYGELFMAQYPLDDIAPDEAQPPVAYHALCVVARHGNTPRIIIVNPSCRHTSSYRVVKVGDMFTAEGIPYVSQPGMFLSLERVGEVGDMFAAEGIPYVSQPGLFLSLERLGEVIV